MQRRNFEERRSSDFASSERFVTEFWEEEGGALVWDKVRNIDSLELVLKLKSLIFTSLIET